MQKSLRRSAYRTATVPGAGRIRFEFVDDDGEPARTSNLALEAFNATCVRLASLAGALATASGCDNNAYGMYGIAIDANAVAGSGGPIVIAIAIAAVA
jgi:hypothetical protein